MSNYTPCGGCGADDPSQRCVGCFHNFGGDSIAQTVSDAPTPETDAYIGTHETHRINGRNIYDHARELERELNAARAYSVELTAKYLEASGEIQAERSELRARVAELEGVLEGVNKAFPDLAEFEDKNGFSLAPLAAKVAKALAKNQKV